MPVGSYPPNAWGLFDMAGNVWELTGSEYADHYRFAEQQYTDIKTKPRIAVRGGSWYSKPACLRSAHRYQYLASACNNKIGLRLVRD